MANVVLLHGIPGSASVWDGVIEHLGSGHTVLAPSLLGFDGVPGPDDPEGLLAPNQARHVLERIDEAGFDDFVLIGHDFGGPVAAHLYATVPDRVTGFGVFATNAFPDTPIPFFLAGVRSPAIGDLVSALVFSRFSLGMMVRAAVGKPRIELDRSRYVGDKVQSRAIATIFGESLRRIEELYVPVEAALRSVTVPAVVGWGDRDLLFPVEIGQRTADAIPGARFSLYEGAGHFLPEERPAEVAADIASLLD